MDNKNKYIYLKQGFTLVELLIVITIIGIISVLVVPNMSILYEQNHATQQSHDFVSSLQLGLSEAETNASNISICAKQELSDACLSYTNSPAEDTWQNGWLVFTDTNNNGVYDTSVDTLIKVHVNSKNKVVTQTPASSVTISQNGTITRGSGNYIFNPATCTASSGHNISLATSGVITIEASTCN